jgi:hypothetical protein
MQAAAAAMEPTAILLSFIWKASSADMVKQMGRKESFYYGTTFARMISNP